MRALTSIMNDESTRQCVQYVQDHMEYLVWCTANIEVHVTICEIHEILNNANYCALPLRTITTVHNIHRAWQYLIDNINQPVDWQTLCDYNILIGQGLESNPGKARTGQVSISGTTYIPPAYTVLDDVFTQFELVRQELDPVKATCRLFAVTCRQQWFDNGNKRTAIMIANHWLIQHGVGVFTLPPERMGGEFQDWLLDYYETAQLNSFSRWLQYHAIGDMKHQGLTQAQQDGVDRP